MFCLNLILRWAWQVVAAGRGGALGSLLLALDTSPRELGAQLYHTTPHHTGLEDALEDVTVQPEPDGISHEVAEGTFDYDDDSDDNEVVTTRAQHVGVNCCSTLFIHI